jgi:hypothetical protein
MAQLFSRRADTVFRVVIALAGLGLIGAALILYVWSRSDSTWHVGKPAPQPIPFRHDLHSGTLQIDCRYCHSSVERAAHAGMPSAQTCMACHSQVWAGASVLEPLRTSLALDQAITWTSVHRLPSYAYFHHGIHVSKGVACETCHGRVDQMPRTVKAETLSMGWCLDCHRDPTPRLRPQDAVFAMGYQPHAEALPADIRAFYQAAAQRLTSCNTCHR